ncbi:hypothetical protein [Dysgonomonas capnocytophagoides]|uniref:hypothetical protein n=1 Tax=Dysgonomonas capnocytophagoides TaxID=45254 RepID=UPI00334267B9
MKTDIYTKIVLTVIAILLALNFFKEVNIIPTAKADTTATAPAPIPNAVQSAPVDVNITHVNGYRITDEPGPGYSTFFYGIPVDIRKR